MSRKFYGNRNLRSTYLANIILHYGLFDDFKIWTYKHQKIKSKYRAANLYLIHKGLRYAECPFVMNVNMDTLDDYYWDVRSASGI